MTVKKSGLILTGLMAALASVAPAPALADVKAGADAWSRGDFAAAISEWQAPAEAGDPDAQFNLAQAYRLGRGVGRDLARAETLYAKAAAQGHVQAADNYGLLLFDRGERARAMPYVSSAADRGDPRAQYLMGIAHFNGDLAPKDWRRAYALMTLAQSAGLPQAGAALGQMDKAIPLPERQSAASLATELSAQAEARRSAQLASADLSEPTTAPGSGAPASLPIAATRPAPGSAPAGQMSPIPAVPRPDAAVAAAARTAAGSTPATAGADHARPAAAVSAPPRPAPAPVLAAPTPAPSTAPRPARELAAALAPKPAAKPPAPAAAAPAPVVPAPRPVTQPPARPVPSAQPAPKPAPSGPWRVQLGAFGVAANADALWRRASARPELSGHPRINVPVGKVVKLQAGGFPTRDGASAACAALAKAGFTCIPAQD